MSADGDGVVSHVGSRLLADAADRTTLTGRLSDTLDRLRRPRTRHDPGRVLVDMAVAVADGASTLSDVAILADQAAVFGPVASDSTCWRLLDRLDDQVLASVAAARARAREVVWAQHAETHGQAFPASRVAGRDLGQTLMIDLDATIVIAHSEKEHPTTPASSSPGNFVAATPVRTPPPTQRLHFPGCRWTTIQISGRARAR